jgi:TRAP-type C4-dicarboxylate transport system substrate-binding protein
MLKAAVLLAGGALLAAGCGLGTGGPDKAGGRGRPVTLRLAYTDEAGSEPGRAATYFANRVRELSGGRIRVRILWQAGGFDSPRWELSVTDMVRTGKAQLVLAPARAWVQSGAASLDALIAPFVITSDKVAARVVAGPLTQELLGGLKEAGAVGLAMVPGGLRHPFAFGDPLLRRADYVGAGIRAPYSEIAYDGWRKLGARPMDLAGADLPKAAERGRVVATESGYGFAGGLTQRTTATGNVTPFARIDVLGVATGAVAELGAHDRDVLRRAAADMTRQALRTGRTDAQLASNFCAAGGRVVLAPEEDVSTLIAAAAPVTASLEREPGTRRLVEEIRSWQAEEVIEPASSCGTAVRVERPSPARERTSLHELDGVYRVAWPESEAKQAGMSDDFARRNFGVSTLTLRGGRYVWHLENGTRAPDCHGPYRVRGRTFWLDMNVQTCIGEFDMTWSLKGDELWLSTRNALRDDAIWWGAKPWRKIAD